MSKGQRIMVGSDGVEWGVEVRSPTHSNAMVVYRHPDPATSRLDRYAWYQWTGPESKQVNSRLDPATVLSKLSDEDLRRLFRRSMPVTRQMATL